MANTSYFSAENSWKRLFFITGKTADEFYMDSGIKMNIEQAIWQELKRNGYERIVFFDNDQKLYCYDDESFKLLTKTTKEDSPGKANAGVSAEPRLKKTWTECTSYGECCSRYHTTVRYATGRCCTAGAGGYGI